MKIKEIEVRYTDGGNSIIKPKAGLIITDQGFEAVADGSIDNHLQLLIGTMGAIFVEAVDDMNGFKELFELLDEKIYALKKHLAPDQMNKEFVFEFGKSFLWSEIQEEQKLPVSKRKYDDLFKQMNAFTKKALDRKGKPAPKKETDVIN